MHTGYCQPGLKTSARLSRVQTDHVQQLTIWLTVLDASVLLLPSQGRCLCLPLLAPGSAMCGCRASMPSRGKTRWWGWRPDHVDASCSARRTDRWIIGFIIIPPSQRLFRSTEERCPFLIGPLPHPPTRSTTSTTTFQPPACRRQHCTASALSSLHEPCLLPVNQLSPHPVSEIVMRAS